MSSDLSDDASIPSGVSKDVDGTLTDPFATPRRDSTFQKMQSRTQTDMEQERPGYSQELVRAADNRSSRSSSHSGPFARGRPPRRTSDQIDPSSPPKADTPYFPTKYSPQKQRQHMRNFSLPFNGSASESESIADEQNDVTRGLPRVHFDHQLGGAGGGRNDPMFDTRFTFRDGRQVSPSLLPQAQKAA